MKLTQSELEKIIKEEMNKASYLKANVKRSINNVLYDFATKYHHEIPLQDIFDVLNVYNIVALQEDMTLWDGFLVGREGQADFDIAPKESLYGEGDFSFFVPFKNAKLRLSWYKMTSGRYEVIPYVS